MDYINITGYKFSTITDLNGLQVRLKSECTQLNLKGTILLSLEGINIFLSGKRASIDTFYQFLTQISLPSLKFRESFSEQPPFKRLIVKIKPEIISMGVPFISPLKQPAPAISPQTFARWLAEKKTMLILDTRNEYEVKLGKFVNAIHLNIRHFRTFPQAVERFITEYADRKDKAIVTYCTGGIRCEKAAIYLREKGFSEVYQLEGGILNYLEQSPEPYFEGECFVFDKRISVDTQLQESQTTQCFACRQPVTAEQQQSALYEINQSCPSCYVVN